MWRKSKNLYHLLQAIIANFHYLRPAKDMKVIAVTGTDGKTTTASFIYQILKKAGQNVALISTVSAIVDGKEHDTGFHVTTPDSFALQSYIAKAKRAGTTHLILEVTSHAIDQNRIYGIPIEIGVLTNITHEHLDYHQDYDTYLRTKAKLLSFAKTVVLNLDDESYRQVVVLLAGSQARIVTYATVANADVTPHKFKFDLNLPGEFNKINALAAIATTQALGIPEVTIRKATKEFKLPIGRSDIVYDKEFIVMIDFAHTPNALSQLLQSLRKSPDYKRIIHVFGSAGERDKTKRPKMGNASGNYSDITILTAEDPRSERVEDIVDDIASGIHLNHKIYRYSDRQEAIDFAIQSAQKGDLVVITGKGHEASMNFGSGEEKWSDYEAVKKALAKRK